MMMSLGKGSTMSMSRGQKLNAKSSTKSDLVGMDDALPQILWGRYLIEAQGYTVEHNILLQDNRSTIVEGLSMLTDTGFLLMYSSTIPTFWAHHGQ